MPSRTTVWLIREVLVAAEALFARLDLTRQPATLDCIPHTELAFSGERR